MTRKSWVDEVMIIRGFVDDEYSHLELKGIGAFSGCVETWCGKKFCSHSHRGIFSKNNLPTCPDCLESGLLAIK